MAEGRRATLHDVARHCGVSYQTVSRVVHNHHYVAEDTRRRVLAAIEELGYRPNRAAQSLAGNRTRVLGMLTSGIEKYGPAQVLIHTEQAARAAGYDLIFAHAPDNTLPGMRMALNHLLHWQVDGLILITPTASLRSDETRSLASSYPAVQIGVAHEDPVPSVGVDQFAGGVLVADYLLALGHRDIAVIAGPVEWLDATERQRGFLTRLRQAGAQPITTVYGDWSAQSGYQTMAELLDSGAIFSAAFAANDQMALGALQALHERGRRVPDDLSLVGFDDIPEAQYLIPPLTTVRQDFQALGQMGIHYLLELIENPNADARQILIPPQLIERRSAAAP